MDWTYRTREKADFNMLQNLKPEMQSKGNLDAVI